MRGASVTFSALAIASGLLRCSAKAFETHWPSNSQGLDGFTSDISLPRVHKYADDVEVYNEHAQADKLEWQYDYDTTEGEVFDKSVQWQRNTDNDLMSAGDPTRSVRATKSQMELPVRRSGSAVRYDADTLHNRDESFYGHSRQIQSFRARAPQLDIELVARAAPANATAKPAGPIVLPGLTFGVFPIGFIITISWTFLFLLTWFGGAYFKFRQREVYRKTMHPNKGKRVWFGSKKEASGQQS